MSKNKILYKAWLICFLFVFLLIFLRLLNFNHLELGVLFCAATSILLYGVFANVIFKCGVLMNIIFAFDIALKFSDTGRILNCVMLSSPIFPFIGSLICIFNLNRNKNFLWMILLTIQFLAFLIFNPIEIGFFQPLYLIAFLIFGIFVNLKYNTAFFAILVAVLTLVAPLFLEKTPTFKFENMPPLQTNSQILGEKLYELHGCWICHTQNVLFENDIHEKGYGIRKTSSFDKINRNIPMSGFIRIGADLSNVGLRKFPENWLLKNLHDSSSINEFSLMPSYKNLFLKSGEPKPEAIELIDYLLSLKQDSYFSKINEVEFEKKKIKSTEISGDRIYKKQCILCHGEDLKSSDINKYPSLKDSTIKNEKRKVSLLLLSGMNGKYELDGRKYDGNMPSFSSLTDAEISSVINFVRNKFNPNSEKILPEEIKEYRKESSLKPYMPQELK